MIFKVFFQIFPFIVAAILFGAFLAPAVKGPRGRAIGLMALLFCAAKFAVFASFGGNAFAPELPEKLILFWNWAYSGMMILAAFAVPGWMLRLPRRFPKIWLITLPALAWAMSAAGVWNGLKPPAVEEVTLYFKNLPEPLDGYRILQLSDIHASAAARAWRTERIVEIANAQNADLICLTGDYADGYCAKEFANIEAIGKLKAKDGVFAVTGNHEYYYDTLNWLRKYRNLKNIRWLVNSCAFPRPALAIGGVNDATAARFGFTSPDPEAAFAGATNGEFRVLLQHRPVSEHPAHADLQLSGHTHGGIAPGLAKLVSLFNGGMVRGAYQGADGAVKWISPGAGQWAGFPIRFFNDPAITVFTIRKDGEKK